MQNMILLFFALFFTAGLYLISAELLNVPTYKATKAILGMGKRERKKARDSDAFIMELAARLSKVLPMDEYRKRKLTAVLKSAEIPMTAEVYAAQAMVKAGLIFAGVFLCLLFAPILSPVFVIIGIAVYFTESTKAEKLITVRRQEIEYELPRFVATLVQELKATRDVLSILESYQKNAGKALKNELAITTSDMRTGNYEGALTRFEARVSSAMLSDVVRGLIGVLRGDDGVTFFQMLSHDMKQLELQRLKRLAIQAFIRMVNKLKQNSRYILSSALTELMDLKSKITMSDVKVGSINQEIAELTKQSLVLNRLRTKGYMDSAIFMQKNNEINQQIDLLKRNRRRLLESDADNEIISDCRLLIELMEQEPPYLSQFDETLFHSIITQIVVTEQDKLKFCLIGGFAFTEQLPKEVFGR